MLVAAGKDPPQRCAPRRGRCRGGARARARSAARLLTGASVPVVGVPGNRRRLQRRRLPRRVALGRAATAGNADAGRVASFSSTGSRSQAGWPLRSRPRGRDRDVLPGLTRRRAPAYASVTGTSVAAATAASSHVARPDAAGPPRPIWQPPRRLGPAFGASPPPAAQAPSTGASAAGEVAASETSLSFGPWNGPRWHQVRTIEVRDVSSRRLTVSVVPAAVRRARDARPRPGQAPSSGSPRRPRAAGARRRHRNARRPAGGRAGTSNPVGDRLPSLHRPASRAGGGVPASFSPSDSNPAALTVVAGRISTGRALQIEPVGRLDVLLYSSGGAFLGVLATVPDLLPGTYRFALTGRGPGGAVLPPGRYEIRLVAYPTLGAAPTRRKIPIRIE